MLVGAHVGRRGRVRLDDYRPHARSDGLSAAICGRSAAKRRKRRIENLMELVSAAREYESRDDEPRRSEDSSIGLSLLSEADEAEGAQEARVWLMSCTRPRVSSSRSSSSRGWRKGCSRMPGPSEDEDEVEEERRHLLRLHHPGARTADADRRVASPDLRRLPGHRAVAIPRRDPGASWSIGSNRCAPPRWQNTGYELRNPYARRTAVRSNTVREGEDRGYSYEHEDQSASGVRAGMRVRHRQFGVGHGRGRGGSGRRLQGDGAVRRRRHQEAAGAIRGP